MCIASATAFLPGDTVLHTSASTLRHPSRSLFCAVLLFIGCATPATKTFETLPTTVPGPEAEALWAQASDVFDRRCTVCHGCYDAPCQLKTGAFDGLRRGGTKAPIYAPSRLTAMEPTRLFVDAHSVAEWRGRDFHPVLPEGQALDPYESLLVRMLGLKREHPLPEGGALGAAFDLARDRDLQCTTREEFDDFAEEHPMWGMPYAMPGLTPDEEAVLVKWVTAGSPGPAPKAMSAALNSEVGKWERFLNREDKRAQLVARYIYEHLFFASLYFKDVDDETFFRMVRSETPPGEAVKEIATPRPIDAPGKERVYYRIVSRREARLNKQHMPYALDAERIDRYQSLFFAKPWDIETLPGYEADVSANPFRAFEAIPVRARYRFMLEEAEYTMMGFIKGPVCHGQTALNVIQDRFWITFVSPESPLIDAEADFLSEEKHNLDMPTEDGSTSTMISWLATADNQREYLRAKAAFVTREMAGEKRDLSQLWDGDGNNDNVALTVFRHFDSATVEKGLIGAAPKTAWVVGYSLLERIHYLLVAGFDVFGNVGHQVSTRMYMDFLRMEGEHNFLLLLPYERRRELVDGWYRDVDGDVKEEVYGELTNVPLETSIEYKTSTPERELFEAMRSKYVAVASHKRELKNVGDPALVETLETLSRVHGLPASHMPELSFVEITDGEQRYHATITRQSAHTNVAHLFNEDARRVPKEDQLTVVAGFLGAYPNVLFKVEAQQLKAFFERVQGLQSDEDYRALRLDFGVLRTGPDFWKYSDALHQAAQELDPLNYGLFDYNRLDAL